MLEEKKFYCVLKDEKNGTVFEDTNYGYGHHMIRAYCKDVYGNEPLAVVFYVDNIELIREFQGVEYGIQLHMIEQFVAQEKKERSPVNESKFAVLYKEGDGYYDYETSWAYFAEEAEKHFREKYSGFEVLVTINVTRREEAFHDYVREGSEGRAQLAERFVLEKKGFECFRLAPVDPQVAWREVLLSSIGHVGAMTS